MYITLPKDQNIKLEIFADRKVKSIQIYIEENVSDIPNISAGYKKFNLR